MMDSNACELTPYWVMMLNAYHYGNGDLGWQLGLNNADWHWVLASYAPQWLTYPLPKPLDKRRRLRAEVSELRAEEAQALLQLFAPSHLRSEQLMKQVMAYACLSPQHLWQDLGLEQRSQLSALIAHLMPDLFELNTQNMRWKRFFYRQLCIRGGDFVCRSPNCESCSSYASCFVG